MLSQENFIGRKREVEAFEDLLDAMAGRSGRLLLVGGQPGSGKTALALEFRQLLEGRGFDCLWAGFPEQADCPPHHAWLSLIHQLAALGYEEETEKLVEHLIGSPDGEGKGPPDWARLRLFELLLKLLRKVSAERDLVIIIDDMHCADSASAVLTELVANELASLPILLVVTYRDTEIARTAHALRTVSALAASRFGNRVTLRGLSIAESAELTQSLSGWAPNSEVLRILHQQTEGNPLYLKHIVQSLVDQGYVGQGFESLPRKLVVPEEISEAIGFRLDRASPACRQTLRSAAILGRNFDVTVLEKLDEAFRLEHLDEAASLFLVRPVDAALGQWQFSHALISEVLYDKTPPMQRISSHARAAAAIEEVHGSENPHILASLAYHSFEGQVIVGTRRVVDLAVRAARHALAVTAYEEAAAQYRLALDCQSVPGIGDDASRIRLELDLAKAERLSGQVSAAIEASRRALNLARQTDDWQSYADAALEFEAARWLTGTMSGEATGYLGMALSRLPEERSARIARIHFSLARAFQHDGKPDEAQRETAMAIDLARQMDDPGLLCDALEHGATALTARYGSLPLRIEYTREFLRIATLLKDDYRLAVACLYKGIAEAQAGNFQELKQREKILGPIVRRLAQPHLQYILALWDTVAALFAADFARAELQAAEALRIGQRMQGTNVQGLFGVQMFIIHRERGSLREFTQLLPRTSSGAVPPNIWLPGYALMLAEIGSMDEASAMLEQCEARGFHAIPKDDLYLITLGFLAETCVAVGNERVAQQLCELLQPYSGLVILSGPVAAVLGPVDRILGRLKAMLGRFKEARSDFEAALAQVEDWDSETSKLRAVCDFAECLVSEGTPSALQLARSLEVTLSKSPKLGAMRTLSERHRVLNDRLRSLAAVHGYDQLTAREIEVLRLLTEGASNAQISQDLHISHATVATHVRNILAKTQSANRTAAAAYARRNGLLISNAAGI